jgi:Holliday junction resolvasome RuvABC endonuclease subunit
MTCLVGVDIGTNCGVAWSNDGGVSVSSIDTSKARLQGGGMRALVLRRELMKMFEDIGPVTELAFENVERHSATYAAQVYGELRGVLMSVCEEMSIPYRGIGVTTVKKHVAGSGIAKKDKVRMVVTCHFPEAEINNDDESDALSVLKCLMDGVS